MSQLTLGTANGALVHTGAAWPHTMNMASARNVTHGKPVRIQLVQKRYRVCVAVNEEDGEFASYCLSLPGAVSCGDSKKEALGNIREAVAECILSYRDMGKEIPWTEASGSKDEYDFAKWIDVDV